MEEIKPRPLEELLKSKPRTDEEWAILIAHKAERWEDEEELEKEYQRKIINKHRREYRRERIASDPAYKEREKRKRKEYYKEHGYGPNCIEKMKAKMEKLGGDKNAS